MKQHMAMNLLPVSEDEAEAQKTLLRLVSEDEGPAERVHGEAYSSQGNSIKPVYPKTNSRLRPGFDRNSIYKDMDIAFAKKALKIYEMRHQGAKFEVIQPLCYQPATLCVHGAPRFSQRWLHLSFAAKPKKKSDRSNVKFSLLNCCKIKIQCSIFPYTSLHLSLVMMKVSNMVVRFARRGRNSMLAQMYIMLVIYLIINRNLLTLINWASYPD